MPVGMFDACAVLLNGKVYIGGGNSCTDADDVIQVYTPEEDDWVRLPPCPVHYFAMATVNGQLVLAGGQMKEKPEVTDKITVWTGSDKWIYPYPQMPTPRSHASAFGYEHFLVVAGGKQNFFDEAIVEILDTSSSQWYMAQSIPAEFSNYSPALLDHTVYLMGGYLSSKVFSISLPALISEATSRSPPTTRWEELTFTPWYQSSPLALHDSLLAVSGKGANSDIYQYNPETKKWEKVGDLPRAACAVTCTCTMLPSGDVVVCGGYNGSPSNAVHRVSITVSK